MSRPLLQRIHNPHNRHCGCDPDCWCNRLTVGRAIKWWFPARRFGIHHKDNRFNAATFVGWTETDIREWKRAQERDAKKRRTSSMEAHRPSRRSAFDPR